MASLYQQLRGYRLTTAEIIYRMPDHPAILQTFVWQVMDQAPKYPRLRRFLDYWEENLDAPLHSVKIGSLEAVSPGELRYFKGQFSMH